MKDTAAVKTLVDAGADVNEKSPENCSSLHWTTDQVSMGVAQVLIENGANSNLQSDNYGTPLMLATYRG